ncbi:MAG: LON peptidase substrate-binding domain-containing protein, partial [Eubacteriales bacterium]|nr:LON peptidase substrate-binding domain-containing protein [Eubacteriales bacterium]
MLETQVLPVIPLRSVVVLPGEVVHCDVGRRKTLLAMQAAAAGEGMAFFCMQKDPQQNEPAAEDLYRVGTIGKIKQVFRIQGEGVHMLVTGMERGRSEEYLSDSPYFEAAIRPLEDIDGLPTAQEALR